MAGAGSLMLHNRPTGWAAFRALRQRPAPPPRLVHGNHKHGMRSKAGREAMRRLRFAVRLGRMSVGQMMAIPPEVFERYASSRPEPAGWRAYRHHAGQARGAAV